MYTQLHHTHTMEAFGNIFIELKYMHLHTAHIRTYVCMYSIKCNTRVYMLYTSKNLHYYTTYIPT